MQDLRLVGISENGEHVLLTDDTGGRYSLPLNDDLKRVVRRDKSQTLGATAQTSPQAPLRPRDVQALIRAGVPLEEIAERAGWSVEKVLRYEGPIRAERDYIGELAQSVILDSRDEPVTLRERAAKRLAERGVEAERVVWDSWKSDEDHWSVVVRFPAGGRLREATWHFDPSSRALRAVDDEARWLGGDENARAPKSVTDDAPARQAPVPARDEPVFDVEAEGWDENTPSSPERGGSEHREELTSAMRQRHANRRTKSAARANDPANIQGIAAAPAPTMSTDDGVEKLDLSGEAPPFGSHPRPGEFLSVLEGDDSSTKQVAPATTVPESSDLTASEAESPETDGVATDSAEKPKTSSDAGHDRRRTSRRSRAQIRTPQAEAEAQPDSNDETSPQSGAAEDDAAPANSKTNNVIEQDEVIATSDATDGDDASQANPTSESESKASEAEVPSRPTQSRKGGRPSVPSWDDIMFGGRSKR